MKRIALLLVCCLIVSGLSAGIAIGSGNDERSERYSEGQQEFYGTIEKLSDPLVGTWVVSGRDVVVSPETKIEKEYGPIEVGAYVEVKGSISGKAVHARKIEVKQKR